MHEKFLNSDSLREMQFSGNMMQKNGYSVQGKGNTVQIIEKPEDCDWLIKKALKLGQSNGASEWPKVQVHR